MPRPYLRQQQQSLAPTFEDDREGYSDEVSSFEFFYFLEIESHVNFSLNQNHHHKCLEEFDIRNVTEASVAMVRNRRENL